MVLGRLLMTAQWLHLPAVPWARCCLGTCHAAARGWAAAASAQESRRQLHPGEEEHPCCVGACTHKAQAGLHMRVCTSLHHVHVHLSSIMCACTSPPFSDNWHVGTCTAHAIPLLNCSSWAFAVA